MSGEMILKHLLIGKFHITRKTARPMSIPFMSHHIEQLDESLATFLAKVLCRMSLLDVLQ
jgi:hypothetical protein